MGCLLKWQETWKQRWRVEVLRLLRRSWGMNEVRTEEDEGGWLWQKVRVEMGEGGRGELDDEAGGRSGNGGL